jgi:hypothetical protein
MLVENNGGSNLRRRVEGICEILKDWQHCFHHSEMLKLSWLISVLAEYNNGGRRGFIVNLGL